MARYFETPGLWPNGSITFFSLVLTWAATVTVALAQSPKADFGDIQFKATHNSYRLPDPPQVLIDRYNVWEIELDFGMVIESEEFCVGHDGPENHQQRPHLREWLEAIASARSLKYHPVIIKLEAKTEFPCQKTRFAGFDCGESWREGWQVELASLLREVFGEQNWITRDRFEDKYDSDWPTVDSLRGKIIVTLQDNSSNRYVDASSGDFFVSDIPWLVAAWPPVTNPTEFGRAIQSGANRVTMNEGYREQWSNLFVHVPLPTMIDSSHTGWQFGTSEYPFRSEYHVRAALWTCHGKRTDCSYANSEGEQPLRYVVAVSLAVSNLDEAGTNAEIRVRLKGIRSVDPPTEVVLNPELSQEPNLTRASFHTYWFSSKSGFQPKLVEVSVNGDDDLAISRIIVTTSDFERLVNSQGGWVGPDHTLTREFPLGADW